MSTIERKLNEWQQIERKAIDLRKNAEDVVDDDDNFEEENSVLNDIEDKNNDDDYVDVDVDADDWND